MRINLIYEGKHVQISRCCRACTALWLGFRLVGSTECAACALDRFAIVGNSTVRTEMDDACVHRPFALRRIGVAAIIGRMTLATQRVLSTGGQKDADSND